jgi:hypothetical protein
MFLENVENNFIKSSHGNPFKLYVVNLCHFWKWVDEMFTPLNIFNAFHFSMVCDGTLRNKGDGTFFINHFMFEIKGLRV